MKPWISGEATSAVHNHKLSLIESAGLTGNMVLCSENMVFDGFCVNQGLFQDLWFLLVLCGMGQETPPLGVFESREYKEAARAPAPAEGRTCRRWSTSSWLDNASRKGRQF